MSCVVKWCKNRSDRKKKNPGITFHRFPKENEVWRDDWIQIIRNCNGENDWIPNKYSVICSLHFEANTLYTTKGGLRRVVTYAVPQKFLLEPTHMVEEQPAAVPYTPRASQESTSVTVPALEHPGSSTMILQREYLPAESNISNALRENSSEIGSDVGQVLSILYSPRKRRLKQSLIKKQDIIKKQKRDLKTLKQKVKRLQNRNKSLKDILKSLKHNIYVETVILPARRRASYP